MSYGYYTLALVAFALFIQQGFGLECYQCNTHVQKQECETGSLAEKWKLPCPGNETMCRKIEQEINIDGDDTVRITRECATTRSAANGECLERTGTYRFKSWYCECDEAGCNSATSTSVSVFVSTVFFSAAYLVKKVL